MDTQPTPMDSARWRAVQALLIDALDLPPEERSALLTGRCGEDDALRLEVLSLVKAFEAAGDYFDGLAARVGTDCFSFGDR